jgi:hypothetical protein
MRVDAAEFKDKPISNDIQSSSRAKACPYENLQ